MSIVVPDKIKQMGVDKNFKIVDAEDVELKNNEYSDVQSFVDGFKNYLTSVVNFENDENGKPIYGTKGQFVTSNADGTVSFTSTTSATDPDLIASDGTKFKFGTDGTNFGYILTSSEGKETFYPFKSGGDNNKNQVIAADYKIDFGAIWGFKGKGVILKESIDLTVIGPYENKTYDDIE